MNILYVDPVIGNTGSAIKYPYYNGLLSGFLENKDINIAICQSIPYDLDEIVASSNFNPDLVLFGLGWFGHYRYFGKIKNENTIN